MPNSSVFAKSVEEAHRRAAEEALARIEHDRQRAPKAIESLLSLLSKRLFDRSLRVESFFEACGIRDHSVFAVFKGATGYSPAKYIEALRLETSKKLLEDETLEISWIAELLGFASSSAFTNAFKRCFGRAPSTYRRLATAPRRKTEAGGSGSKTLELCRMAITGRVQAYQTWCLIEHLTGGKADEWLSMEEEGYGQGDLYSFEEIKALGIWDALQELEEEEKGKCIQADLGFRTSALFDLLLDKGRELGEKDAQCGVVLTELAIKSLDPLVDSLPEERLRALAARGWRSLGRALQLAQDFEEAERAFATARGLGCHQPVQK